MLLTILFSLFFAYFILNMICLLFYFILYFLFFFIYRKDCFDSKWFGECLKVLFIPAEEVSQLQDFIKIVNGSPINFNMPPITT